MAPRRSTRALPLARPLGIDPVTTWARARRSSRRRSCRCGIGAAPATPSAPAYLRSAVLNGARSHLRKDSVRRRHLRRSRSGRIGRDVAVPGTRARRVSADCVALGASARSWPCATTRPVGSRDRRHARDLPGLGQDPRPPRLAQLAEQMGGRPMTIEDRLRASRPHCRRRARRSDGPDRIEEKPSPRPRAPTGPQSWPAWPPGGRSPWSWADSPSSVRRRTPEVAPRRRVDDHHRVDHDDDHHHHDHHRTARPGISPVTSCGRGRRRRQRFDDPVAPLGALAVDFAG